MERQTKPTCTECGWAPDGPVNEEGRCATCLEGDGYEQVDFDAVVRTLVGII